MCTNFNASVTAAFSAGPSRGGGNFPVPRDVWRPSRRSRPKICIKSIFGRGPLGELTTLPRTHSRMVRGHLPRFLPLDAFGISISRHTDYGMGVIGLRDNVFPGLALALDGPDSVLKCEGSSYKIYRLPLDLLLKNTLCNYVAAKATYIRLLYGKWGFFGPSSVKRSRTHIVLG